jgi:hypothetical protein
MNHGEQDDLGGWGPKAWDQLAERLGALERMLGGVLGKTPEGKPKLGQIGMTTKLAFLTGVFVPIVVAIIMTKPWA